MNLLNCLIGTRADVSRRRGGIARALLPVLMTALVCLTVTPATAQKVELPIYVEDSPAAADLMAEAQRLRAQDRLTDAVAVYQRVIKEYGYKLLQRDKSRYAAAAVEVRRQLSSDEQLLAAYVTTFEPAASRLLERAALQPLPEQALRDAFERYSLTPSGRQAGLQLAGVCIERGGGRDALMVLNQLAESPGGDEQALAIAGLRGVALLVLGDQAGFDALVDRMATDLARPDQAEALRRYAGQMRVGRQYAGQDAGQAQADQEFLLDADAIDQPLWTVDLDVPERRLSARQAQAYATRYALRVLPTHDDGTLFFNESESVLALDLRSGRTLWRSPASDETAVSDDENAMRQRMARMPNMAAVDPRGVMVAGDRVVAVLGASVAAVNRWRPSTGTTDLICMDRTTGQTRWRLSSQDLDPAIDKAYFHGTPIRSGSRLYVLLRRSQVSGFHDSFIACLDIYDGGLIWMRHLSSAVSGNRYASRPLAEMIVSDGRVFTVDNLGAITCMDASTGLVHWAHLLEAPQRTIDMIRSRSNATQRLTAAKPVLLKAGLLAVPASSDNGPRLIDPDTGLLIREIAGLGLAEAQ